jgi:hypothetical protein
LFPASLVCVAKRRIALRPLLARIKMKRTKTLDNSNWSTDYAEALKHYGDVREQRFKDRHFSLAQHKEFMKQMKRGESIYVRVET